MRLSVLMSLRTQLDAVQISIDGLIADEQKRQEDEARPRGCQHEKKMDLRTMGEQEHWRCRECGFENLVLVNQSDGTSIG